MKGKTLLSRRDLLTSGAFWGTAFLLDLDNRERHQPSPTTSDRRSAGAQQIGVLDFVNEGSAPMDKVMGTELDGRLYTDLSRMTADQPITSTEHFYIRTRASTLLPPSLSWSVKVDGLIEQSVDLGMEFLTKRVVPIGPQLLECAGNARVARFGMISVANWEGILVSEILNLTKLRARASQVVIAGFDQYSEPSTSSLPGASWVFPLEELKRSQAILATTMNGEPLTVDHGAPVRLLIPGWYGCACIKWVNRITVVDDTIDATSQMQEYAARTLQNGVPRVAKDYRAATIEPSAMPIRVEKWAVTNTVFYRVIGILWGGLETIRRLEIRFNPDEDFVPVDDFQRSSSAPWSIWTHTWKPQRPSRYAIRLAIRDPYVRARKLDAGYYVRSIEISEI